MKRRAEEIYTSYKKSLSEDYSLSSLAPCLEKTSRFKGRKEVGDKLPLMTEIMKFLVLRQKLNPRQKLLFLRNLVAPTAAQNTNLLQSSVASAEISCSNTRKDRQNGGLS